MSKSKTINEFPRLLIISPAPVVPAGPELILDRAEIAARCQKAAQFAKEHDFHAEFQRRMAHLARASGVPFPEDVGGRG